MPVPADFEARVRYLRTVVARFAPTAMACLSREWDAEVAGLPEWTDFCSTAGRMTESSSSIGVEDVEGFARTLEYLLDLWDEEPMGSGYYPYKAVELIHLHVRMAVGDLRDDAPVSLAEWIGRFARHVDWQLEKSGVNMLPSDFFRNSEVEFRSDREELSEVSGAQFVDLLEKSNEASALYVTALRSALQGAP